MVAELPKTTEENTGAHKPRQRRPKERSSKKQHKKKKGSEGGDQPQFMSKGAFQYLESLMGVCDKPFLGGLCFEVFSFLRIFRIIWIHQKTMY